MNERNLSPNSCYLQQQQQQLRRHRRSCFPSSGPIVSKQARDQKGIGRKMGTRGGGGGVKIRAYLSTYGRGACYAIEVNHFFFSECCWSLEELYTESKQKN